MVDNERLVRAAQYHGTLPSSILEAMRSVDRRHFVPEGTPPADIYDDKPVGIGSGQTTSQPSLVAAMVHALHLTPQSVALEVGTGYGYQTALMAILCRFVVSIERIRSLSERAAHNLRAAGFENIRLVVGDAWSELPEGGPFDGIVVSAAADTVPETLEHGIAEGGRMVIPIGPGGSEIVKVFEKREGVLREVWNITGARFVPLRHDRATGSE